MAEPMSRPSPNLSRQTVQLMMEMKQLLRSHGILISLTSSDALEQLIQGSEGIEDESVRRVRQQLTGEPEAEEAGQAETPPPAPNPPGLELELPSPARLRDDGAAQPMVPRAEEAVSVAVDPLPSQDPSGAAPVLKKIYPHSTQRAVIVCDACQTAISVRRERVNQTEPLRVDCSCGRLYVVEMETRQFPRKSVRLPGRYVGLDDETKAGEVVVENLSFGGMRFRLTEPQTLVRDDRLMLYLTLDDDAQTAIEHEVIVRYVSQDIVGAAFDASARFEPRLAAYLIR